MFFIQNIIDIEKENAGGGIRTHEHLNDRILSPAPLARLGDPRLCEYVFYTLNMSGNLVHLNFIICVLNFNQILIK